MTMVVGLAFNHASARPTPLGSAFTYQGQLKSGGNAYNGTADFVFTLYDAATAGVVVGAAVPVNAITIVNGTFTTNLDFGTLAFDGNERWLEIAVHTPSNGGAGPFTTLSPRQRLAAAPYALTALNALNATIAGTQPNQVALSNAANSFMGSSLLIDGYTLNVNPATHRVGIGVISPSHMLTIASPTADAMRFIGPGNYGTNARVNFEDSTGNVYLHNDIDGGMIINTNGPLGGRLALMGGNVGIYALAPARALQIGSGANLGSEGMIRLESVSYSGVASRSWDVGVPMTGDVSSGTGYSFVIDDTLTGGGPEFMVKWGTGNVGIGTTTPQSKLDVNGTVTATSFALPATTRRLSIPCSAFDAVVNDGSMLIDKRPYLVNGTVAGQALMLTAPVNLPDGAVISSLAADVLDADATQNISVRLTRFTPTPPMDFIGLASSSGSSATYQTLVDSSIDFPVVNNAIYAYSVEATFTTPASTGSIRLYRVVISYTVTSPLP